jgi:hypothetical protein
MKVLDFEIPEVPKIEIMELEIEDIKKKLRELEKLMRIEDWGEIDFFNE